MKKIAIYTIQSNNIGNRLQNYALQNTLQDMGYEVCSLKTYSAISDIKAFAKRHRKVAFLSVLSPIRRWLRERKQTNHSFKSFNKKIVFAREFIDSYSYSLNIEKKYDAFIAGSDQIWNVEWFKSVNVFLPFSHPYKIAYAASFGTESINDNSEISECLESYRALSVREESGIEIIRNLTGRDAVLLPDPTLLLSSEAWQKIEKKPVNVPDKYILLYFLSPMSEEATRTLKAINTNLDVFSVLEQDGSIKKEYGPAEFLWLIRNAELVLTDSFHASVFSFIFDIPFMVFDRNYNGCNMNSRIETFCKSFDLQRKYAGSKINNDIWEHDYSVGHNRLEKEKKRAEEYLYSNLPK